jgi:hypothetical protein
VITGIAFHPFEVQYFKDQKEDISRVQNPAAEHAGVALLHLQPQRM